MTTHEINLLIERYLDGETTPAEERELALAVQREDRPAEWAIIAEMLGELTADEAIYDEIMAQRASKPAKRLTKLWPWAAAACAIVVFGLSYSIIKEEPQEMANVELPQPVKTQTVPKPVLVAREEQPSQPLAHHNKHKPQIEQLTVEEKTVAQEPLPEVEPQLIAEAQELTPPIEDLSLYMALLAEVEARAAILQQEREPLLDEVEAKPEEQLLFDELLVNIQQQSNRPELSL